MIKIGKNISSDKIQRNLARTTTDLSSVSERLASGQRINRASDDAAGLAIATSLTARGRVYSQALRNANDGISVLSIAEGALNELTSILNRQLELAQQAANGTYTDRQRAALNTEAAELTKEYNRIISSTTFNGVSLLDGSYRNVQLQIGFGGENTLGISIGRELLRNVGDGTFSLSATYSTSNGPTDSALLDVNGDGRLDLLVQGDATSLRLGQSNGTFGARQDLATSTLGRNVGTGDVDSDGDQDIITIGDARVFVMRANGNGTFAAAISSVVNSGGGTTGGGVGDFNNDGRVDVFFFDQGDGTVGTSLSNGSGTFASTVTFSSGGPVSSVTSVDLDRDGRLDLLVTNNSVTSSARLFRGNGDGTFGAGVDIVTGQALFDAAVGDLNRDGVDDLALVTSTGYLVALGNGDGTYGAATSYATSATSSVDAVLGDFNGDDNLDLITVGAPLSPSQLLVGKGDGTFGASVSGTLATPSVRSSAHAVDVTQDEVLDLVVTSSTTNSVHILQGNYRETTTIGELELTSVTSARQAITKTTQRLDNISRELSVIGSTRSRLDVAASALAASRQTYMEAQSRIMDADVAEESSRLVALTIRQQVATAILGQANLEPALALKLLKK